MKFFFPDSQDQVSPTFDFETERHTTFRVRQRDDIYPHEALAEPAYGGMLVSKAIVDGTGPIGGRYTLAQRHRFYRLGVRRFLRLDIIDGPRIDTIGDCGAFSYVKEDVPPVTVDEVIEFYECGRFDFGVSIDHVILNYDAGLDCSLPGMLDVPLEWKDRQDITLQLAAEFLRACQQRRCAFTPMGVAQGWSPSSYAHAVDELQRMGYKRIGIGGMVPLKTHEILASLRAIDNVRRREIQLHLFGVTRCEHIKQFESLGVTSFDSTSPFMQAFKDNTDNYYTLDSTYVAIRIPQVDGNMKLKRQIQSGAVDQGKAIELERRCREAMVAFDRDELDVEQALEALQAYEMLYSSKTSRIDSYRRTLTDRPWKRCSCRICQTVGHEVVVFRGAERNKRRGFHNLYVFNNRLKALSGARASRYRGPARESGGQGAGISIEA